jgi:single-strand DNA-binding protein
MSVNKSILVGNLGADAEVRFTGTGVAVANMRICTNERFRDREGNLQERAEWHRVAYFNVPEKLIPHLTKGRQLYIEGKMESRKYTDSNGIDRFSTQVVVRPFHGDLKLLGRPKEKVEELVAAEEQAAETPTSLED